MNLLRQRVDHGTARRKEREEEAQRRKLPTPHPWRWTDKDTDLDGSVYVGSLESVKTNTTVAFGGACQAEGMIVINNEADAELLRSAPEMEEEIAYQYDLLRDCQIALAGTPETFALRPNICGVSFMMKLYQRLREYTF